MTRRVIPRLHAACLALALAAGPAAASFVWVVDAAAPARIEVASGASRALAPGRVDAVVPLRDGGAWIRTPGEVLRLDAALEVAARASVAGAGPLLHEPASRRLWVASGAELLRFDEDLRLEGVAALDGAVRGLAASGPDAIWIVTDATLSRFDRAGMPLDAVPLATLGIAGPVAGVLADAARARVWIAAGSGDAVAVDAAGPLRATQQRLRAHPDTCAIAVEPVAGALYGALRDAWLPLQEGGSAAAEREGAPAGPGFESTALLRLAPGGPGARGGAVTVPVVVLGCGIAGEPLRAAAQPSRLVLGPTIAAAPSRWRWEVALWCGSASCADADALLATVRADLDVAGHRVGAPAARQDGAWTVEIAMPDAVAAAAQAVPATLTLVDAYGNAVAEPLVLAAGAAGGTVPVRAGPKGTPVVAITSPAANAVFVAPATVPLAASASVSGATLAKVEFLRNGSLLATDTSSPYTYAWTGVAAGTYTLTARAWDSAGGSTTSAPVPVTVNANAPPGVAMTAPAPGTVLTAPATIGLAAHATDADGGVAKVEFFRGTTRIATDTTAPYAHAWTGVGGGTYSLTARATDDKGAATTSAAVTVVVNRPPATAITAPAGNATLVAPLNLAVAASASDADGSVAKVEFFRNGTLAATDTSSPWGFTWSNVPTGTHTLTARATDNRGAATTSAPVTFTVNANLPPAVTLTSPAAGARFSYPAVVPLAATASDGDGSVARVEFHYDYGALGTDTSSPYALAWNSPYVGTFTLTARAVDNKGAAAVSAPVSITIAANQPPAVTATGTPPAGEVVASAPPTFVLEAAPVDSDGTIVAVRFQRYDAASDAFATFATAVQPPYVAQYAAQTLDGEYWFRIEAVDNAGDVGHADLYYMVVANRSPQVRLIEPGAEVEWSGFVAPATVVIVVDATEFDPPPDRIARVEVLVDGLPVGALDAPSGTRGEYVHVWRDVPAGSYALRVRAVDAFGAVGEWQRNVQVLHAGPNASVAILQPVSGEVYRASVPLQAVVEPGATPVTRVDYVDTRGRRLATSSVPPYAAAWNAPAPGRHAITAVAIQANGIGVSSPTVHVDVADAAAKRPPLVVLTAPAASGTYAAGAPLAVEADALADGAASIARVDFFANGAPIGTAAAEPYRVVWSDPPAGAATLTAVAVDSTAPAAGSTATSSPVGVTLAGANPRPVVTLTAPAAGASFVAPASVALAADASDANGSVVRVEFRADGVLVGTDTSPPFAVAWRDVPAGTYAITATAVDDGGAAATSDARSVMVVANAPPQVALTAPLPGQSFAHGAPVTLAATAADPDGPIARVEFLDGETLLHADTSAPYAFEWTGGAVGAHVLAARAYDAAGAVTVTPGTLVTITSDAASTAALLLPLDGQRFVTGQAVDLVAVAGNPAGGVARVDFLAGGVVIGSSVAPPFALRWTNVPGGTHALAARVHDASGTVRTSAPATIHVAPLAAAIAHPPENASIAASSTLVHGTFAAPANSGVLVNGVRAHVDGGRFLAEDVPLVDGANTLRVVVVTADGQSGEVTRNITRSGSAALAVRLEPAAGVAPHTATLHVDNPSGLTIAQVAFEELGAASLDTAGADQTILGRLTLAAPGVATPTIVLTDSTGTVHRVPVGILAASREVLDAMLRGLWSSYAAALVAGRVDLALASLPPLVAARYRPILEPLAPHFPQIVPTWSAPQTGLLADDLAEYAIGRTIDGQKRLFFVYFVKDGQGLWRLDAL